MMPRRAWRIAPLLLLAVAGALLPGLTPETRPAAAHTNSDRNTSVTAVAITSTPTNGTDYRAGENIVVRVTFDQNIHGYAVIPNSGFDPTLKITIGATDCSATPPTAVPTPPGTTLDYTCPVTSSHWDPDGITIAPGALTGVLQHRHTGDSTSTIINYDPNSGNVDDTAIPAAFSTAQAAHKVNSHLTGYDTDGDNLIEIDSLPQLNAIRYDLDGNGAVSAGNQANYTAAFDNAAPGMGCAGGCAGYELFADLDFDTDEDGSTHTSGTGDADDAYYNGDAGWAPIGSYGSAYAGTFDGNHHTIANLFIKSSTNTTTGGNAIALFASTSGAIRNLVLHNPYVSNTRSTGFTQPQNSGRAAALAARVNGGAISKVTIRGGTVTYSHASSSAATFGYVGCLVGEHNTTAGISDSGASCAVSAAGISANNDTGGYVTAGGLAGRLSAATAITDSYATGTVGTSGANPNDGGGLVGLAASNNDFTSCYATGNVTSTAINTHGSNAVGGLIGELREGNVRASYATGAVAAAATRKSGGLVGIARLDANDVIQSSYATGSVTRNTTADSDTFVGGLIGQLKANDNSSVTATYATGAVSKTGALGSIGGLVGGLDSAGAATTPVAHSYWNNAQTASGGTTGATSYSRHTAALQSTVSYASTGIFANWNQDLDGTTGGDDPWDFGTASQYPILQYGHDSRSVASQRGSANLDYDANDNNLIEIATPAQLDAIRWDLDGDGNSVTGANAVAYAKAFPNLMAGMGCPDGCIGYELTAELDLDTDEDGSTHTAGTGDDGDTYYNGGAGWDPIGDSNTMPYNAVFDGQGYVILNLFINGGDFTGLFGAAGTDAVIRGVGLPDAYIDGVNGTSVGALVGANSGTVAASWSSGRVEARQIVGGLVGRNGNAATATVTSSYSTAAVESDGGGNLGNAGGLVGYNHGRIVNSYAAGAVSVTGTPAPGGLAGGAASGSSITASYFDSEKTTGSNSNGTGQTTSQLQTPLAPPATGAYADWSTDNWDFGTASQYPILNYAGNLYGLAVQRPVDYSGDNNLIDVGSLLQLNAIRWDLDGNGRVAAADTADYLAAFPGMVGCRPACVGYELTANLDFDTDDDGSTHTNGTGDAHDDYYNTNAGWTPIGDRTNPYTGQFNGRGYTISNLFINSTAHSAVGLFGAMDGAQIESVGLLDAYVAAVVPTGSTTILYGGALLGSAGRQDNAVRYSYSTGALDFTGSGAASVRVGGLVGSFDRGVIAASWSAASVTTASTSSSVSYDSVGGLLGLLSPTGGIEARVLASYATGAVNASHTSTSGGCAAGGLIGYSYFNQGYITASYATGATDCTVTGATSTEGGLVGTVLGTVGPTIAVSYWDSTRVTISSTHGAGQATNALQSPAGYTGIYADWDNYDVDNADGDGNVATGADAPWNFGTASQYPVLQLGYRAQDIARQRGGTMDYDANDNNLIEVGSLPQLNAIRYDLDGDGKSDAAGADAAAYLAAFPGLVGGMGCPDGCAGYELTAHLDFDTNGDGTADTPYASWTPLGDDTTPYAADFHGQGYTISNLRSRRVNYVGLFGVTGADSALTGVGLPNVDIVSTNGASVGALAGVNRGTVAASWSSGSVTALHTVGGLLGRNGLDAADTASTVTSSYSTAAVSATENNTGNAGGLVGYNDGRIVNSYAAGAVSVTGTATPGGLAGGVGSGAVITASYFDSAKTTGSNTHGTSQTTTALTGPLAYGSGIYAAWNVDVDNAGGDGNAATDVDDPWDFGAADQYPILKYGGNLYGQAVQRRVDYSGDNNLIDVDSLAQLNAIRWNLDSNGVVSADDLANYLAAFPGMLGCDPACAGYELTTDLDFAGSTYIGGAGWTPLGVAAAGTATPYTATFDGGGHTISNLRINLTTSTNDGGSYVGLFGDSSGTLRNVGLVNPSVSNTRTGGGTFSLSAALTARNNTDGVISNSWVDGGTVTVSDSTVTRPVIGCLVGYSIGAIRDSWASCAVSSTSAGGSNVINYAGGLVGYIEGGGGITGSYATGAVTLSGNTSLNAGGLAGQARTNIISSYATGAVTADSTVTAGAIGGLVGAFDVDDIKASWASGNVSAVGTGNVGGLVGNADLDSSDVIQAGYATGTVRRTSTSGGGAVGGLIGMLVAASAGRTDAVQATYAIGAVSNADTTTPGAVGGLVGGLTTVTAPVSNSYWATDGTGRNDSAGCGNNCSGATAANIRTPTGYDATPVDYSGWNLNIDRDVNTGAMTTGSDDPWDFGTSSQYPVLKYGHDLRSILAQRGQTAGTTDYDANDNNLIDIGSGAAGLAQLNAIRYDLDGDGVVTVTGAEAIAYLNAYPGLTADMGCPDGCEGYELTAHLDFDTNGDGEVTSADDYESWVPIGQGANATAYNTRFAGNGYTIANLTIKNSTVQSGLFGQTGDAAVISGVGLPNVNITSTARSGALAGTLRGAAYASWSSGSLTSSGYAGGLVGVVSSDNNPVTAALSASWSKATVTGTGTIGAGGLVGRAWDTITYSYATGVVTNIGSGGAGGLVESVNSSTATITGNYWDTTSSRISTASTITGVTGYATSALKMPTEYGSSSAVPPDIYAAWNVDTDGDSNIDDPWDFGTNSQYPILEYAGRSTAWQGRGGYAITASGATAAEPLTVTEADNTGSNYGIDLAVQPDAAVTVTIVSPSDDDVTIDTGDGGFTDSETLTFTTANWNTPQTLTLKAATDANIGDDTSTDDDPGLTLTAANAAASALSGYAGVSRKVHVTAVDSSVVSIDLSVTTLSPTESASRTNDPTYTVVLSNQPDADVTVSVVSSDTSSIRVSPATLTFHADTMGAKPWNTAQTVTASPIDDDDSDNESVTITHTATDATGTASGYASVVKTLSVSVRDNDAPNLLVSESSLTLTESTTGNGHQDSFNVRLNTLPTAAVTVGITSSNADVRLSSDGGTTYGSSVSLTFDRMGTNIWSTARTVNVQAEEDNDGDNDTASLSFNISGGDYGSVTHSAISVTVTDNDTKGITLSETGNLAVREGEAPASYTVVLDTEPSGAVSVAVSSNNAAKVSVSARSGGGFGGSVTLSFNDANYSAAQTVYVRGNADDDTMSETGITIGHTVRGAATSASPPP